ncbi:uncharacterized protein BDR25DRAFT_336613 [Lindgomyces ingoldianus]|uniref:Uncharacterized protein n=1 Tax=Lindgomyces ingoldianus TaxID=673940 RepID=A0ACB6QGC5_9PLEO|nr:uncharacterized protein BDR25DRAFT_336613 [Lindgomyces ingoldianus]KAF2466039.1 hypothetical protein BDR25DRAFT_336613 [Lindgomyces ingoldianus]
MPSENAGDQRPQPSAGIFAVPAPIKRLFDKFPLLTYSANDLPLRAPRNRDRHVLHVFTTPRGAELGSPSYNPACLKWQAYLRFCNIDFVIASSNNHASPSGSLPFLLPSLTDPSKPAQPVPSGKLQRWVMNNSASAREEPSDLRYEAYLSLLDHRIRRAWLYTIYLSSNSTTIAEPFYILPASNNPFVRLTVAYELRCAAEKELLKASAVIDSNLLYKEAEESFAALEMLLGSNNWFFGAKKPGLFDASVFAYTHLLMDENFGNGWVDSRLRGVLLQRKNLVTHRNRILTTYFP